MAKLKPGDFKAQAQMFKALAHPGRLLMLDELSRGERCVCGLADLVGSEMPTADRWMCSTARWKWKMGSSTRRSPRSTPDGWYGKAMGPNRSASET
jgi:hypothetical protein